MHSFQRRQVGNSLSLQVKSIAASLPAATSRTPGELLQLSLVSCIPCRATGPTICPCRLLPAQFRFFNPTNARTGEISVTLSVTKPNLRHHAVLDLGRALPIFPRQLSIEPRIQLHQLLADGFDLLLGRQGLQWLSPIAGRLACSRAGWAGGEAGLAGGRCYGLRVAVRRSRLGQCGNRVVVTEDGSKCCETLNGRGNRNSSNCHGSHG